MILGSGPTLHPTLTRKGRALWFTLWACIRPLAPYWASTQQPHCLLHPGDAHQVPWTWVLPALHPHGLSLSKTIPYPPEGEHLAGTGPPGHPPSWPQCLVQEWAGDLGGPNRTHSQNAPPSFP